jgi:hypothetical protein
MFGEAIAEWQRSLMLDGDDELATRLSSAYAEADFAGAGACRWRRSGSNGCASGLKKVSIVPAIGYARAYLLLGDKEQAFHWLGRACRGSANVFPLFMSSDPFYDSVRTDPRFQELLRRVG